MKIKKFVRRHRTAIFTASMIGTGIIIGMHIKKNDYSNTIDLACNTFNQIGARASETKGMVDILLGSTNKEEAAIFECPKDIANDLVNDILNACKEIENETQKEA